MYCCLLILTTSNVLLCDHIPTQQLQSVCSSLSSYVCFPKHRINTTCKIKSDTYGCKDNHKDKGKICICNSKPCEPLEAGLQGGTLGAEDLISRLYCVYYYFQTNSSLASQCRWSFAAEVLHSSTSSRLVSSLNNTVQELQDHTTTHKKITSSVGNQEVQFKTALWSKQNINVSALSVIN